MENNSRETCELSLEERKFLNQLLSNQYYAITYTMKKYLGDMYSELCDECLSDVYWLAVHKVRKIMELSCPEKWLLVATKILSLNSKRRHFKQLNYVSLESIEDVVVSDDIFEIALHNIWMEQDVYNRLKEELTRRELEIFELMFEKHKSYSQIASELKISESTVWNIRKTIKDKYRYAIKNKLF